MMWLPTLADPRIALAPVRMGAMVPSDFVTDAVATRFIAPSPDS